MTLRFERILIFAYGSVSYLLFLGAFVYVLGFMTNVAVPKSIDSGMPPPVGEALLINVLLLAAFAVQHSGMARPAFKAWLTRSVPESAERSTYVLISSLLIFLLFWQWRPISAVIWEVDHPAGSSILVGLPVLGWLTVFYSTILIDHFDLFGMRQVTLHLKGNTYTHKRFMTPSLYKYIRHPLYLGWLILFWATPRMTAGHLLFALVTSAYIFIAVRWEERDLMESLGEDYIRYREVTPMILPLPRKREPAAQQGAGTDRP